MNIVDDFDAPDSTVLGHQLTWTEYGSASLADSWQNLGQSAVSKLSAAYARADSALTSAYHFASILTIAAGQPLLPYQVGVAVRCDPNSLKRYQLVLQRTATGTSVRFYRNATNYTGSALGTTAIVAFEDGAELSAEVFNVGELVYLVARYSGQTVLTEADNPPGDEWRTAKHCGIIAGLRVGVVIPSFVARATITVNRRRRILCGR